jgi:RNA polymerase sigma-70 factor (ECF subfamily)
VLRYCLRWLRRPADAEDALQQTFLQAHRALDRGVEPEAEAAWLLAIARNVCLTRSDALRRRAFSEVSTEPDAVPDGSALLLDDGELAEDVRAALAVLPTRQRDALFLREWHELSYAEIARALGTTEAAVETLVFRARRALARELEPMRRRRVIDFAGLLGWVRGGLGPAGAKVAVGAAVATVTAGSAVTVVVHRGPAPVRVPAQAHAAPARVAPASARVRRSSHVVRAHRARATPVARPPHHVTASPVPPATAVPASSPVPVSPQSDPARSDPAVPAAEQAPTRAATEPTAPVADTGPSAVAPAVSQVTSTVASVADAVASTAADAVPAAAPVTSIAADTVDKTAATVNDTVSKLLPGH